MDIKAKPLLSSRHEYKSYAETLVDEILGEDEFPIVNYDLTYEVRKILSQKRIKNFEMIVYHGYPSVTPHFTLNVVREESGTEIIDLSREQAEGLRTGTITPSEIISSMRTPLPVFVPLGGELVRIDE